MRAGRCLGLQTQALEDLLDHRLLHDGGDDHQLAAKLSAMSEGTWPIPGLPERPLC
jgi:hypothetical protein